MKKLIITLSGPIASFSPSPRMQHRLTQYAPTKSAIVGMIACAMGIPRDESIEHLQAIVMRVISISGGEIEQDFQAVRESATNDGAANRSAITTRHYVPDYCAEVEIEGDDALIDAIEHAVRFPQWQLYIGRRAQVLDRPLVSTTTIGAAA